ncbi:hypothetical protein TSTA_081120 [Talaromyces stipitatus ATCC 10500]|uniref:Uncharacterized protein n=1 Tax=Talaromyces stipitatus (strain ATCC 10500 / CBS 375.48 / QM 6759 / NRRL 1006) TaxID=441959 RepID=B8LZU7_TALSN|nr:uncharacterized protein TSTA_081120 [Talaromyces stipitatus ATCC 10500]EED20879.1 hypothetical protein TSTA_081120 [Talaromyces stipitatus ATCC 10500]
MSSNTAMNARAKDVIGILQGTQELLKKPINLPNDDFLTAPAAPINPIPATGANRIGAAASAGRQHHNNTAQVAATQGKDTQPTPTPDSQETVQAETMNKVTHTNKDLDRATKIFNVRLNLYKQCYFE